MSWVKIPLYLMRYFKHKKNSKWSKRRVVYESTYLSTDLEEHSDNKD